MCSFAYLIIVIFQSESALLSFGIDLGLGEWQHWEWVLLRDCRWLRWTVMEAMRPSSSWARCKHSPEMLGLCCCSTPVSLPWRTLSTPICNTSTCRCHLRRTAIQTSSPWCSPSRMWLHCVGKAIISRWSHWRRDSVVSNSNGLNARGDHRCKPSLHLVA